MFSTWEYWYFCSFYFFLDDFGVFWDLKTTRVVKYSVFCAWLTWNAQIKRSWNVLSIFSWFSLSVITSAVASSSQAPNPGIPACPDKLLLLVKKLQLCGMSPSPPSLTETHTRARTQTWESIPSPWFSSHVLTCMHLSNFCMFNIPQYHKSSRKMFRLNRTFGSKV